MNIFRTIWLKRFATKKLFRNAGDANPDIYCFNVAPTAPGPISSCRASETSGK